MLDGRAMYPDQNPYPLSFIIRRVFATTREHYLGDESARDWFHLSHYRVLGKSRLDIELDSRDIAVADLGTVVEVSSFRFENHLSVAILRRRSKRQLRMNSTTFNYACLYFWTRS